MQKKIRLTVLLAVAAITVSMLAIPASATSIATKVLRGAAVGYAVTKAAGPLDSFINKMTLQNGMASNLDTKVVPILSVGEKGYVGGAQVSGPKTLVNQVKAVFEYEKNFDHNQYRIKVLVPSASLNPLQLERVDKVGISAIIEVALDGKLRYQTVGSGFKAGDVLRGAAVAVAIKNAGNGINNVINTVTLNKGLATKVVPMASFGEKAYIGGAQVASSTRAIDSVNAVWQYEDLFDGGKFRIKVMVPTTSSNPLKMKRVDGAGITAVVDMALAKQKDVVQEQPRSKTVLDRIFGGRDDRNPRYVPAPARKDNGKHTGWYIGERRGRKHAWVDEKWQKRFNEVNARNREPFMDWLDGRNDRSLDRFDTLYKEFLRTRR